MKKTIAVILVALMMLTSPFAFAEADNTMQIFYVNVTEEGVEVHFYLDTEEYLTVDDFELEICGVSFPVEKLNSYSKGDLGTSWVAVLEPTKYAPIAETVHAVVESLVDQFGEKDSLSVYNTVSEKGSEFLKSNTTVSPVIDGVINAKGSNRLWDTIREALKEMGAEDTLSHRKSLLIITEGRDQESMVSLPELEKIAEKLPIAIYTVGLTRNEKVLKESFETVRVLTDTSGSGRSFSIDNFTDPEGTGASISEEIRQNEKNCYTLMAGFALDDISPDMIENLQKAETCELKYTVRANDSISASFAIDPIIISKHIEDNNRKEENNTNVEEFLQLGNQYYTGDGIALDYQKAAEYYLKAAELGNAAAQSMLGKCYYYGYGVDQNYKTAVEWFEKSAYQGNMNAQYDLGVCYQYGRGTDQSMEKAAEYYRKAAEQGYDYSQYVLGQCYYYGDGVTQDYKEAVKWFKAAAGQGNSGAQYYLGECYYYGYGVDQNYRTAVEWYEKAAEQGDDDAQYSLGWCYEKGQGIEQNYEKAIVWYTKAAEQGNESAAKALADLSA